MLRPRIIPCLLVSRNGLVKTVGFKDRKYVGDPLNAVKIFNEKEVDELMVVDIDASVHCTAPDFALIKSMAAECRMPLCYGGGIKSLEQAVQIIKLGVEKVAISSAALGDPELITRISRHIGAQSTVVVLDVRRRLNGPGYEVWTHNAQRNTGRDPVEVARQMQALGVGEIVINSIDADGTMKGYDRGLVRAVRDAVSVPMTVLGGAASLDDVGILIDEFGIIGAAAGSLFVFKGVYRAVLISYPDRQRKARITARAWKKTEENRP